GGGGGFNRASPSSALEEIHQSEEAFASFIAVTAAESPYVPIARMASVRTRRSESRRAARSVFSASADLPAESVMGRDSPRTAHSRTSGDLSCASASSAETAAGSRGRKSAHVARQRISSSDDFVQRRIGARSPRVLQRPIE